MQCQCLVVGNTISRFLCMVINFVVFRLLKVADVEQRKLSLCHYVLCKLLMPYAADCGTQFFL